MLTCSIGWRWRYCPRPWPSNWRPRLAMTSLAFMLVEVPAPPWMMSTTNSSWRRPPLISSPAAPRRSPRKSVSRRKGADKGPPRGNGLDRGYRPAARPDRARDHRLGAGAGLPSPTVGAPGGGADAGERMHDNAQERGEIHSMSEGVRTMGSVVQP